MLICTSSKILMFIFVLFAYGTNFRNMWESNFWPKYWGGATPPEASDTRRLCSMPLPKLQSVSGAGRKSHERGSSGERALQKTRMSGSGAGAGGLRSGNGAGSGGIEIALIG